MYPKSIGFRLDFLADLNSLASKWSLRTNSCKSSTNIANKHSHSFAIEYRLKLTCGCFSVSSSLEPEIASIERSPKQTDNSQTHECYMHADDSVATEDSSLWAFNASLWLISCIYSISCASTPSTGIASWNKTNDFESVRVCVCTYLFVYYTSVQLVVDCFAGVLISHIRFCSIR